VDVRGVDGDAAQAAGWRLRVVLYSSTALRYQRSRVMNSPAAGGSGGNSRPACGSARICECWAEDLQLIEPREARSRYTR
jgi:hypothetical protein